MSWKEEAWKMVQERQESKWELLPLPLSASERAVNKTDKHSNFCYKNIWLGGVNEFFAVLLCFFVKLFALFAC